MEREKPCLGAMFEQKEGWIPRRGGGLGCSCLWRSERFFVAVGLSAVYKHTAMFNEALIVHRACPFRVRFLLQLYVLLCSTEIICQSFRADTGKASQIGAENNFLSQTFPSMRKSFVWLSRFANVDLYLVISWIFSVRMILRWLKCV